MKDDMYTSFSVAIVGWTVAMLITLFTIDEMSYDSFHEHAERIVRLGVDQRLPESDVLSARTPRPLRHVLSEEIPGVQREARH